MQYINRIANVRSLQVDNCCKSGECFRHWGVVAHSAVGDFRSFKRKKIICKRDNGRWGYCPSQLRFLIFKKDISSPFSPVRCSLNDLFYSYLGNILFHVHYGLWYNISRDHQAEEYKALCTSSVVPNYFVKNKLVSALLFIWLMNECMDEWMNERMTEQTIYIYTDGGSGERTSWLIFNVTYGKGRASLLWWRKDHYVIENNWEIQELIAVTTLPDISAV